MPVEASSLFAVPGTLLPGTRASFHVVAGCEANPAPAACKSGCHPVCKQMNQGEGSKQKREPSACAPASTIKRGGTDGFKNGPKLANKAGASASF